MNALKLMRAVAVVVSASLGADAAPANKMKLRKS